TFARAMGAFHERFHLYMTPATASPPVVVGSLDPSAIELLGMKAATRLKAGRALRWSGIPEKIAFEQLGPVPFTQLANLTGQPAMSLPLHGPDDGLPRGVHFMAAVGEEATLFRVAAQLEAARPWAHRRPSRG